MPIMPFARNYNVFGLSGKRTPPLQFPVNPFGGDPERIEVNPLDKGREVTAEPNPFAQSAAANREMPLTPPEFKEGPMLSNYRRFIEEGGPRREDFKPTKMQRVGATLSSIGNRGGFEGTRDILDRPYNQALFDRNIRGQELQSGAKLETETDENAYKRFLELEKVRIAGQNADSLTENRRSLIASRESREGVRKYLAENPDHKIVMVPGGNIMAINPKTQEVKDLGISSGTLTDEDKLEIQNTNALGQISARGDVAERNIRVQGEVNTDLENTRQTNRLSLEDKRQEGREKIVQVKKDNPTFKIVTSKGGNYFAINPEDPTEVIDTGVATGTLTDEDKAELGLVTTTSTTRVSETDSRGNPTAITRETTRTKPTTKPAVKTETKPNRPTKMTDPEGNEYDVSSWSDEDIEQARKRKWK